MHTKYKHGGVYVVIGGAGGIGEAWSEYMIRTYQAQIVWIGRRKKDAAIQSKLDRLARLEVSPYYIQADAANREELERAYETMKQTHHEINGIIHSAIVLQDRSLMNMSEECFRNVLAAKVDVSVRITKFSGMNHWILFCFSLPYNRLQELPDKAITLRVAVLRMLLHSGCLKYGLVQ